MNINTTDIQQIDLLKGFAIISVILGHIVSYQVITNSKIGSVIVNQGVDLLKNSNQNIDVSEILSLKAIPTFFTHWITFSSLTTQQVVPIFIIILSFNLSLSFQRKDYSGLQEMFSRFELKKRFRRYFIPYFSIFLMSLIIGLVFLLITNQNILTINFRLFLGYLPIDGPGNYFIPLIIQMVVFFPVLYVFYKYNRYLCLIAGFVLAFFCEIINHFGTNATWYSDCLVRFLPLIILGIWISDLYLKSQLKNKYFILFGIISGIYLIIISQFEMGVICGIHFIPYTADQNLFACGWPSLILILGLLWLPKMKNFLTKSIAALGKSSYHIYLVQIVYFGIFSGFSIKYHTPIDLFSPNNVLNIVIPLSIIIVFGYIFYFLDQHNFFMRNE
jgi:peptidoglycan/LPS O-acetylase OafA/YrhL